MFADPRFFRTSSGVQLAYDEYGDPAGRPVLFFHGWPASRLQGAGIGPAAQELGLRIISPDRPGIGLSDYQPGRALLDWPPMVAELIRALGISRFRVLAVSGGAPYALATAWAMTPQVEAVTVISGAPPLDDLTDHRELLPLYRLLLGLSRRFPALSRRLFWVLRPVLTVQPPAWLVKPFLWLAPKRERETLSQGTVFEGSFQCYREAWRGSAFGVATDGEIYSRPWGFRPEEISVPVHFWHGTHDTSFHHSLARQLAARVPGSRLTIVPEEGHYSLPIRHYRTIMEDLAGTSDVSASQSAVA